jgi:hypothetical protein
LSCLLVKSLALLKQVSVRVTQFVLLTISDVPFVKRTPASRAEEVQWYSPDYMQVDRGKERAT